MAANYVLLEKITVGAAGASSVTFSGIPQTGYTDLVIKSTARTSKSGVQDDLEVRFNGLTTNRSSKDLLGNGSSAASYSYSTVTYAGLVAASLATTNTFSNGDIYIPNYTSSNYKSYSSDNVTETNATNVYSALDAGLWSDTSAITSITLQATSPFVQYSTFYLYGVAKLGTTPAIVPYATGGDTIMTDGTYWYHAFKSSGTFTPAKGLSCDVLVVAGGGGGGGNANANTAGGGGGAGGVLAFAAESLASGTGYTVTIGAGGSAGTTNSVGSNGSNSQFASLTALIGGGGGGSASSSAGVGSSGGSGGGGGTNFGSTALGGSATSGQGNAGGTSYTNNYAGGGGGKGAVGTNGSASASGPGGAGTNSVTNWGALSSVLTATGLGVSGYIAGGGGGGYGGSLTGNAGGIGGSGGGGQGATGGTASGAGIANTGSGGGGNGYTTGYGGAGNPGAGGSGLVIVRYAV
jgi:hypothetical protein